MLKFDISETVKNGSMFNENQKKDALIDKGIENLKQENESLKQEIKQDNSTEKAQEIETLKQEIKQDELAKKDQANEILKQEIEILKQDFKQDNSTEKAQEIEILKKEIESLKQENETLKQENETLKQENETLKQKNERFKEIGIDLAEKNGKLAEKNGKQKIRLYNRSLFSLKNMYVKYSGNKIQYFTTDSEGKEIEISSPDLHILIKYIRKRTTNWKMLQLCRYYSIINSNPFHIRQRDGFMKHYTKYLYKRHLKYLRDNPYTLWFQYMENVSKSVCECIDEEVLKIADLRCEVYMEEAKSETLKEQINIIRERVYNDFIKDIIKLPTKMLPGFGMTGYASSVFAFLSAIPPIREYCSNLYKYLKNERVNMNEQMNNFEKYVANRRFKNDDNIGVIKSIVNIILDPSDDKKEDLSNIVTHLFSPFEFDFKNNSPFSYQMDATELFDKILFNLGIKGYYNDYIYGELSDIDNMLCIEDDNLSDIYLLNDKAPRYLILKHSIGYPFPRSTIFDYKLVGTIYLSGTAGNKAKIEQSKGCDRYFTEGIYTIYIDKNDRLYTMTKYGDKCFPDISVSFPQWIINGDKCGEDRIAELMNKDESFLPLYYNSCYNSYYNSWFDIYHGPNRLYIQVSRNNRLSVNISNYTVKGGHYVTYFPRHKVCYDTLSGIEEKYDLDIGNKRAVLSLYYKCPEADQYLIDEHIIDDEDDFL